MDQSTSEERLLLLESWKQFEEKHGDPQSQAEVEKLMPKRIKKRRPIQSEDGTDAGWEEYYEYIFPADQASKINFKLLEAARMWKERNAAQKEEAVPIDRDAEHEHPSVNEQIRDEAAYQAGQNPENANDSDTDLEESSTSSESSSEEEEQAS